MDSKQPAGQQYGQQPRIAGRPYDSPIPPRPITAAAPPRTSIDGLLARHNVPSYQRPGAPAPAAPPSASPVNTMASASAPLTRPFTPQPGSLPTAPPSIRPLSGGYQDIRRSAAPTVYSPQATLPGQSPADYRQYLDRQIAAEKQYIAATDDFLEHVPPPVEVPPKPVASTEKRFAARTFFIAGKTLKTLGSTAVFFGLVWGGATLLNAFVFQSYYVDGLSMQPSLGNNDRLIISKLERTVAQVESNPYIPERGQIVVISGKVSDYTSRNNEQLIKRVIGLPGDTVIIQNGVVMIKNKDNPEGFNVDKLLGLSVDPTFTESPLIVTVPQDAVFVMGDNRSNGGSFDSRAFGPVPSEYLLGRLWARILPTDKLSVF